MMRLYLFIGLVLLGIAPVCSGTYGSALEASQAVETYVNVELAGGDPIARKKIIKFSHERETDIKRKWPGIFLYLEFSEHEPQFVVDNYKVNEVRVDGVRATATVVYKRIARTESTYGTPFVAEPPHDETVTLNLIFKKNQWWVLDPPPPRVSKKVLLDYYEATIKRLRENGWLTQPNLSSSQKAAFDKDVENLRILKSLP